MKLSITHFFSLFLLLTGVFGFAQNLSVNGKVSDIIGFPIPGVNIKIQDKVIAISDIDGKFTVKIQKNATLIFSSVGFETKSINIGEKTSIDVVLNESKNQLEEVLINVGYGFQKKKVVTGAISRVTAKDLEKVPIGRVEQALQGRVAGVTVAANSGQPGSESTIRVRGVTTFGGGNNPLYVVDGFVVGQNGIGYLNQSDIESIEVLKDAVSAAIYGTRAATGVILVTTKKGKKGKISVNYNGFSGVSAPSKKLNLLNSFEYGTLMNEKSVAGGGNPLFAPSQLDPTSPDFVGQGTDWQKAIFNKRAMRYSHELSFSGGNETSNFYVSFGLQDQQGIVVSPISNFNQKSIRINSNHKINKHITFGQTLGYARKINSGIGDNNSEFNNPLISAINLDPTTRLVERNPNVASQAPYSNNAVIRDANGNPYGISALVGQEITNPLAFTQTRLGNYGWTDDFVGNAFLELTPIEGLAFKTILGGKLAYWGGEGFTPKFYLNANQNTAENSFGRSSNRVFEWSIENTVTYSKKIKKHNFSILVAQAAYVENIGGGLSASISNLPINNFQDASFNFDIPQANRRSNTYDFVQQRLSSYFTRFTYDFDEKYLLTAIFRRDGSTRFGFNNKFGFFPSFSAGWVVSNEGFWKENNVVNLLKLRGGFGVVGNNTIRDYGYAATVTGGNNYSFDGNTIITGYAPNSLDNPNLRWEQTAQTSFGIETKLFNSLNITFDYFKKSTSGILREIIIPGYIGVGQNPVANVADMDNSGLELELNYAKKIGGVNFSIAANGATLQNKVTNIGREAFLFGEAGFQTMGAVTRTLVGESYNSFFGYQTAGIFQTVDEINAYKNAAGNLIQPNAKPGDFRWSDTDGDGAITEKDRKVLGSSIPKYTYGLTLNAEYKGFDLSIFMQGAGGNKIFQGLRRLDIANANYQTVALGRWTGEGTSNTFPRLTSNDTNGNFANMSDFYLEDGDYLRLKLLQIGYSLPSQFLTKINAQKIRLYVTAENLLTFTRYSGFDPEIGGGVFGIDKGFYPQSRTFIFGTTIQF